MLLMRRVKHKEKYEKGALSLIRKCLESGQSSRRASFLRACAVRTCLLGHDLVSGHPTRLGLTSGYHSFRHSGTQKSCRNVQEAQKRHKEQTYEHSWAFLRNADLVYK